MTDPHDARLPPRSGKAVRSAVKDLHRRRRRSTLVRAAVGLVVLAVLVWAGNHFFVEQPVRDALAADPVAAKTDLSLHLHYFVDPTTLVLDVGRADTTDPETVLYALVVAASQLHEMDFDFRRVLLVGRGGTAFIVAGIEFDRLGAAFAGKGNPVEWARRVPPLLRGTAGSAAFGPVAGPLPPLLGLQAADAESAARRWIAGTP